MGVVASKWQQFGGGGGGGRGRRRRSILVVHQDESTSGRRLQMASSIAAQEQRERSQLQDQEVLRACRSGLALCSSSSCYQNHYSSQRERHDDPEPEEGAEAAAGAGGNTQLSAWVVVERQLHGESETVERWKQLYLEIKTELDDLIQRTRQLQAAATAAGGTSAYSCSCGWRGEAVELRGKVSAMERDAARREREMDILRQSLRILTLTNSRSAGITNRGGGGGSRCAPLNLRRRSRMRLSLCLSS